MSLEIKIDGIKELNAKLGKVQGTKVLRAPMHRSVFRLRDRLAQYPAKRPNNSYVRTGTLGKRWVSKILEIVDGLQGRVGNNTEYAPLVQSKRFQARVHRGLWINTDEFVLTTERQNIINDFRRAIREALR